MGLKTKQAFAVLIPEVAIAPAAAIGAVYYASHYTPERLKWMQNIICKYIVEPHMGFFEPYEKAIQAAHEHYDKERAEEAAEQGRKPKDVSHKPETKHERAMDISEVMAKGTVAFGADILGTLVGQHVLDKYVLHTHIPVCQTTATEVGTHLAFIAAMPRFAAGFGENMHFGISKALRHHFGMSRESADEKAVPYTYVTFPGQMASLVSLAVALKNGKSAGHAI